MKNSNKKSLREMKAAIIAAKQELIDKMEEVINQCDSLYMALEEQYDNLSERSQENEVGEKVQDDMESVDALSVLLNDFAEQDADDADLSILDEIIENIDDILEQ